MSTMSNYDHSQRNQQRVLMGDDKALHKLKSGIQAIGMREDYKRKRVWAVVIGEDGEMLTGYYGWFKFTPEAGERSAHYVYKTVVKVQDVYRGQSGFQIGLMTPDGYEIETGATGTLMIMKALADGRMKGNANGEFELNFVVEKKGQNVYIEPYFGTILDLVTA